MPFSRWITAGVVVAALGTGASAQLLRPYPYHVDFPYEVVPNFFKPNFPAGWTWGEVEGAYAESPDRIYVFQEGLLQLLASPVGPNGYPAPRDDRQTGGARREFILTIFDGTGNRVGYWTDVNKVLHGHGVKANPWDPDKHVWLINNSRSDALWDVAILKYTRDGKEVMRIGSEKETGCPQAQDIWFLPNGDFWCLSQPPNGGVIRFSGDGKRLMEFGNRVGSGPGEFRAPHSIAIDRRGRIYVGDRGNYRIQIFDQGGGYLDSWPDVHARSMGIDKNDRLWVICGVEICGRNKPPHSMAAYDLSGKLLFTWGVAGAAPGQMFGNGQFDVDRDGNLYIGEVGGGRVQKWRPRKGANPEHLIQYPLMR
jgi:hypothetical protein